MLFFSGGIYALEPSLLLFFGDFLASHNDRCRSGDCDLSNLASIQTELEAIFGGDDRSCEHLNHAQRRFFMGHSLAKIL